MIKFVYVILHYLTDQDTIECVESIRKHCDMKSTRIIVVDNGSPNDSIKRIMKIYSAVSSVQIIRLKENLGFARGNNVGIKLARQKFNPDFVIVLNNDIIILDDNQSEIQREYDVSKFAVLGPMIFTADGRCNDNPGVNTPMDKNGLKRFIRLTRLDIILFKTHLWKMATYIRESVQSIIGKQNKMDIMHIDYLNKKYNVQLHGSFFVLF